jgi:geranylgeranylglycerol-phosphate geranylgeranyltransferase
VQSVVETLKLIRIANCLLAAVGVVIGAHMASIEPVYYGPFVTAMAAFFVCAAGNSLNDVVDVDIDRIIHPERVLVHGSLSVRYALVLTVVLDSLAVILAAGVNAEVFGIVVLGILLLVAYNLRLKRLPLLGNLVVAILAGLTFMAGGYAVDSLLAVTLPGPLIAAVFAFVFHLVREIVKEVQDLEGDSRAGYRSLPIVFGPSTSLMIALFLFVVLVILTLVPIWMDWFGRTYEIITVYVVDLPLMALLIFLWGNPSPLMLRITSHALKAGMVLGLIALISTEV